MFWDDLENACLTAKELNFDAVEIFAPNPETLKSTSIKKALADNGLALAAVGTGAGWVKHKLHLSLPNPAERKKLYDQETEILMRDRPVLMLWHRNIFTGYNAKIRNFSPYPDGIIRVKGIWAV